MHVLMSALCLTLLRCEWLQDMRLQDLMLHKVLCILLEQGAVCCMTMHVVTVHI